MLKKIVSWMSVMSLLVATTPVGAQPSEGAATLSTKGTSRVLTLPSQADHSPVISLGLAVDPASGELVEGYAIVHYRKGYAKGGGNGGGGSTCYGYMASGAKWKAVEPWVMNTSNGFGLDGSFLLANQSGNIVKWEDAADGVVGNNNGVDILGDGSATSDALEADASAPDGTNEVYFGAISDPGAIAVTTVWGVFGGPPAGRKLVEWDQVFNTAYDWSVSGEAGKMDFENISTHELGHSAGMADLYTSGCSAETMYGYADYGQTNKRDLNTGDITGINKLY